MTYALPQILSDLAQTDGGICPDARLLIVCRPCQELEQIPIDGPVREFVNDRQNSFHSRLSNNRRNVRETRCLALSAYMAVSNPMLQYNSPYVGRSCH